MELYTATNFSRTVVLCVCRNEQNEDAPIPDAASALAVLQDTFVANTHERNVEQLMRDSLYLVSKDGTGTVVGFITIVQESEKAEITALGVNNDFQRKGHGRQLIAYAIRSLNQSAKTVYVLTSLQFEPLK